MGRSRYVDARMLAGGGRDPAPGEDEPRDPDGIAACAPYRRAIRAHRRVDKLVGILRAKAERER